MAATSDEEELKDLLKTALVEAPEENRDLVQDIVEEAMEEFALAQLSTGWRVDPYTVVKCLTF